MKTNQKFHEFTEYLKNARIYCEQEEYTKAGRCLLNASRITYDSGCQGLTEKIEDLVLHLIYPYADSHIIRIATFDTWLRDIILLLDQEEN